MSVVRVTCEWCGKQFSRRTTKGPVPRFCSKAHRQRAYEQRRTETAVRAERDRLTAVVDAARRMRYAEVWLTDWAHDAEAEKEARVQALATWAFFVQTLDRFDGREPWTPITEKECINVLDGQPG